MKDLDRNAEEYEYNLILDQKLKDISNNIDPESISHILWERRKDFNSLNKELLDQAYWINKKDYYILYQLFDLKRQRSSWEIVIEYLDGRIIGHHIANESLRDFILKILKDGILCEKGSDQIKDSILYNSTNIVREAVLKEISKYIKKISVQITRLERRGWVPELLRDLSVSSSFFYSYDSPFYLSIEHGCLPSCIEEFVGIDKTVQIDIDSLDSRLEKQRREAEELEFKKWNSYNNSNNDDADFYAREAFYYLTGGQAGDYEDYYPEKDFNY